MADQSNQLSDEVERLRKKVEELTQRVFELQTAERERAREVRHRVKNNWQLITSLLDLQSGCTEDPDVREILAESQHRIHSIALIHEQLFQSPSLTRVDWGEHISNLASRLFHLHHISFDSIQLEVKVKDINLDLDAAIPCGLIINELVSNSLRHAFPASKRQAGPQGVIHIQMYVQDDQVVLIVGDNGVGLPPGIDLDHPESLGLQLVRMLAQQLGAEVSLERDGGTTFKIVFPYSR